MPLHLKNGPTLHLRRVSAMEKILLNREPPIDREQLWGFRNGTICFQVACTGELPRKESCVRVAVRSPVAEAIRICTVEQIPVRLACFPDADNGYLCREPSLLPDPLFDLRANSPTGHLRVLTEQWQSLWVEIDCSQIEKPGKYRMDLYLYAVANGTQQGKFSVDFTVTDQLLPRQSLIRTNWLHADCLAEVYHVPVFGPEHWRIMERYISLAVRRGINTVYTPLFTPPLDTAPGRERPTTQLVDVYQEEGHWRFGFRRLKRWINMCLRCGVEYFEFSHLYTQWGAKAAPKILVHTPNGLEKRFGWETPSIDSEYRDFLAAFLPELTRRLTVWQLQKQCFFHISDEPRSQDLKIYQTAREQVLPFIRGFHTVDALSDISFVRQEAVDIPVAANDHIAPFLEMEVRPLWTYYCVSQYKKVSNCFVALPAARTRIIGVQLYKFKIDGFLHWGYNFYYSQYSGHLIDPFFATDAEGFAPVGDAFLVYPGPDGQPVDSIRLQLLQMAMEDLRALQLLESYVGRQKTMEILEQGLDKPITFDEFPTDPGFFAELRLRIAQALNRARFYALDK